MGEFPAHLFRVEGDPGAIRSSAGKWSAFGTAASEAAGQITALDTSQFVGPEGDLFRDGLNESMPDHLRITGDAFGKVTGALTGFAGSLSGLQERMRPLAARAPGLWEAVQNAQGRVADAQGADEAHDREVAARAPDQPAVADAYQSDTGGANTALTSAQRAWQDCVDAANGLRSSMVSAVDTCVRMVDEAKGMRFKENPKWYDLGGQFTNFVRDNKELLQQLSGALKIVSLVAGVLSFVPFLAPVMAPLALGTALAASAIDLSIYAATGEGDLTTILVDVGLTVLPGVGKLARMGMARYADDAARSGDDAVRFGPSSPPRPGGCFVAGTMVLTVDGRRPIESLLVDDEVVTGDPHSGTRAIHPVRAHFSHTVPVVLNLTVQKTRISCSPEHPFWTDASGWTKAADLNVGDVLVGVDSAQRPISTITRQEGTFVVYNIEVDGLHTYHVSELHLLVHNKPMRVPRPEGTPKKVDDKYLKRNGIDPHTAKEGLPGPASRFDIYVDRNGNMFGVPKGGKPEDGEFLGNIADG